MKLTGDKKKAVTKVKNQEVCGAWSYGVTGALEGQNFFKTDHPVSLSEQELVDCAVGTNGCANGFVEDGYNYVIELGLSAEADYPYEVSDGKCHRGSIPSVVTENNYVVVVGNEAALREAVGRVGPISVGVDVRNLKLYSKGIFLDSACSYIQLNHAVLAAGYETEDGDDYWLIKHLWGVAWREDGYVRIARNANSNCGIATHPTFPII